jgi:hypothetical protein
MGATTFAAHRSLLWSPHVDDAGVLFLLEGWPKNATVEWVDTPDEATVWLLKEGCEDTDEWIASLDSFQSNKPLKLLIGDKIPTTHLHWIWITPNKKGLEVLRVLLNRVRELNSAEECHLFQEAVCPLSRWIENRKSTMQAKSAYQKLKATHHACHGADEVNMLVLKKQCDWLVRNVESELGRSHEN